MRSHNWKALSLMLEGAFGLAAADWALCLLDGQPPVPVTANIRVETGPAPPLDQIQITCSAVLGTRKLLSLYSDAREKLVRHEKKIGSPYNFEKKPNSTHLRIAGLIHLTSLPLTFHCFRARRRREPNRARMKMPSTAPVSGAS